MHHIMEAKRVENTIFVNFEHYLNKMKCNMLWTSSATQSLSSVAVQSLQNKCSREDNKYMAEESELWGGEESRINRVIASSLSPLTETPGSPKSIPSCSIYPCLFFFFWLDPINPSLPWCFFEKLLSWKAGHDKHWGVCSWSTVTSMLFEVFDRIPLATQSEAHIRHTHRQTDVT